MGNEIVYLLKERFEFNFQNRWHYDVVRSTTEVNEAIAWKNSSPWRVFEVDETNCIEVLAK